MELFQLLMQSTQMPEDEKMKAMESIKGMSDLVALNQTTWKDDL
jgi:hypothetical protein